MKFVDLRSKKLISSLIVAMLIPTALLAQEGNLNSSNSKVGVPKLERLKNLRAAEEELSKIENSSDFNLNVVDGRHIRALDGVGTYSSFVGDTSRAIETFNRLNAIRGVKMPEYRDGTLEIQQSEVRDAIHQIVKEAKNRQIVILNEAHHMPMHRAFAMMLARELRKLGFTYMACETFTPDSLPLVNGIVNEETGYYSEEPMYANFLRDAASQKWNFISYEPKYNPKLTGKERRELRESEMARNIIERVLKKDPQAKIFVYVGYGHAAKIPEAKTDTDDARLAGQLKRLSGIDPLTIEQVMMSQHFHAESQHRLYDTAVQKSNKDMPSILVLPNSTYLKLAVNPLSYDLQVVHQREQIDQQTGRATWLSTLAGFNPHDIPLELLPKQGKRVIYAFYLHDPLDAMPVDVVLVEAGKVAPKLMLPAGEFRFSVED